MSKPETRQFTCPVCGYTIKAPFTEKDITEHIKNKHPNDKTLPDKVARYYPIRRR